MFGPELKYIKGENNVVADALSRLDMNYNQDILNISELLATVNMIYLLVLIQISYFNIAKQQKTYAKLQQKLVSHKVYTLNTFCGGDQNHCLIYRNRNI